VSKRILCDLNLFHLLHIKQINHGKS